MKVLIAASIYPPDPGGPALHAKEQYERFNSLGYPTTLVALAHFRKYPRGVRHALYFCALIRKAVSVDVVYAHDAVGAGIPALIAAKILRKKFAVRIGGDLAWETDGIDSRLSMLEWYREGDYQKSGYFKLSHWLLQRADLVIVPSWLLKNLYKDVYGVRDEKMTIIPNPTPDIGNATVSKGASIIFASRLVRYKNIDFVLRVLADLLRTHPQLEFVIMGDGPERAALDKMAVDLGISGKAHFLGSVPQARVIQETARCLFAIAPALTEFNPNYILQAIALRKPFLISREYGLPQLLPPDFTFDPKNAEDLKTKIVNLLDEARYERAVQEVKSLQFRQTWESNIESNLAAIGKLLNGSK